MVMYIEACESGSIFEGTLDDSLKIYAVVRMFLAALQCKRAAAQDEMLDCSQCSESVPIIISYCNADCR